MVLSYTPKTQGVLAACLSSVYLELYMLNVAISNVWLPYFCTVVYIYVYITCTRYVSTISVRQR